METFLERQGFYDYINHFIVGAVLVIGIEIMLIPFNFSLISATYQKLYHQYLIINSNGTLIDEDSNILLWNICIIFFCFLLFYLIGILVQELYYHIYSSSHTNRSTHTKESSTIRSNKIILKIINFLSRLLFKVRQENYIENIFEDCNIIPNNIKRKIYKRYAEDIIKEKFSFEQNDTGLAYTKEDLSNYFYAYCVYYIQIREKNKKTEKLRDIEGLAMSLSLAFLMLTISSTIALVIILCGSSNGFLFEILNLGTNMIFSILFDCYAERALKNRIRMTLALYEVEHDYAKFQNN